MTKTWQKYEYVCPDCDAHIEMTLKSDGHPHNDWCPKCMKNVKLTLMSVVDATIYPTEKKEETMDITTEYNPNLLVTYKKITNGETEYVTDKVTDIEWLLAQNRKLNELNMDYNNKTFKLENVLTSYAQDADEDTLEVIKEVADIFNVELTKEIEITGTMTFSATITVPLTEDYDIESLANDALQVSSWGGDVDVSDYSVDDVREAY